jgi:hypothetical protein
MDSVKQIISSTGIRPQVSMKLTHYLRSGRVGRSKLHEDKFITIYVLVLE